METKFFLISSSERFERNKRLEDIIKNKLEKEKDSKKLLGYEQEHKITLNRKKSRLQQEELKTQQTKLLAEAKLEAEKLSKIHRKEAEKQSKIQDKERKKKITIEKSDDKEGEKTKKKKEKKTDEKQILDKEIKKIFKNVVKITGGIITLSTLLKILKDGAFPKLKKNDLLKTIDILKEKKSITYEISFSGAIIYVFGDLVIDDDIEQLIKQFIVNQEMDVKKIGIAIDDWSSKKIKRVIKRFEDLNLIKKDKKNYYYLPGLINAKKKK